MRFHQQFGGRCIVAPTEMGSSWQELSSTNLVLMFTSKSVIQAVTTNQGYFT